ncbi:hypothetical protein OX284_008855 [Flavobacterium sp. SUN046]|uniref:hypothetical protein n=1 Tax=Flavobacterium sp. SUN046 TaxID=3002440 RepID=UPI002DBFBE48|nr:hypothetical protein [Flavobacterium sp. SUN046]MEC4049534.1 hypothetical protein [Flavobacterium sp. SUN046]
MNCTKLLFAFIAILSFSSCTITERMIINDNGGGKFSYEVDATKMMSMMGGALKGGDDKKEGTSKRAKKVMDSTFAFKDLFASKKDSIAKLSIEEQQRLKKMENFTMHMVVNEEKGEMRYSMDTDFKSVQDLQDMMSPLESMKAMSPKGLNSKKLGKASGSLDNNSATKYFYDGKSFKKIVSTTTNKKAEAKKANAAEDAEEAKMKESMEMIYGQSDFKIVYQFPKAVKSVSIPNALYSDDRKTVTIEYPLKDYMEHPDKLNFEIEFQ